MQRALIIRSDYEDLPGGRNNAECMKQVFAGRKFDIIECLGPAATRQGILDAYAELIAKSNEGDAAVIYYSGHAGLVTNSRYEPNSDLPRYVQHLCPTDYAKTQDDQFYGVSTFELSLLAAALTAKTTNATVIFDCCYSAQMSRDAPALDPKYVTAPVLTRVALTKHLEELRVRSKDFSPLVLTGNPNAVRIAAAGQHELAVRVDLPYAENLEQLGIVLNDRPDELMGAMTLALIKTLVEAVDRPVPWRLLAPALRARLFVQRPEIEGPVSRVPFSLATVDASTFSVRPDGDAAVLDAGTLLGVSVRDVYGIMGAGSAQVDQDKLIASITIDEVTANRARSPRIEWANAHHALPVDCVALAISHELARYPVRVDADPASRASVEVAMRASNRVRVAADGESPVLGSLRVSDGSIVLSDSLGPLFPPAPYPDCLADAVLDLGNLATERRLHDLSTNGGIDPSKVSVTLGVIDGGEFRAIEDHGTPLGLADRIALRIENKTDADLFANVFNIGLRRRISLLSGIATSGVRLPPNKPVWIGDDIAGKLVGFGLGWPDGLARDRARTDTVMVMITAADTDLRVLESDEHLARGKGGTTTLQELLMQLATGQSRGGGLKDEPYAIVWRDYPLFPLDASLDLGRPEVDASPDGSSRPRAAGEARIRLGALTPLTPTTRTDVLVCACSARAPFRATTLIDGPHDAVIYEADLDGAADVYIWTSEDRGDRRSLAELLANRPIDEAIARLRDPALGPGASLALANLARDSLRLVSPTVATAFRGSFGSGMVGAKSYTAGAVSFELAVGNCALSRQR